jgi:FtsP/CotA-like multicopper oxidase with cupredoxin domain
VTIPGPLIRVRQGPEIRESVRNLLPASASIGWPAPGIREEGMKSMMDPTLVVHGLRAGSIPSDTILVPRGGVRAVRFRADRPGTYLYWATPSSRSIETRTGRDAPLAGAIIVDPISAEVDSLERVFVITTLDQWPDSTGPAPQDEYVRRAINGRSWPETERLEYEIGDTVQWRWVNASAEPHPMHLHGFHFRVLAKGDGFSDTSYALDEVRLAVTELMEPGSTFRMEWVPTTPGTWIVHCHVLDHIIPTIPGDDSDLEAGEHALRAMAGLVIGVSVTDVGERDDETPPIQELRLLAQQSRWEDGTTKRGFVLDLDADPPADSVAIPGPPLILTRGSATKITVVNRLTEPTTVHWHGLELESVYDDVAGWSRTGSRIAPLVQPGDSFAVVISPPRTGTFIYHTHMDETDQLAQGMAGPLLVYEPGDAFDPSLDRVFLIGGQAEGSYPVRINNSPTPAPAEFRLGVQYRLRFIHITRGFTAELELGSDTDAARWRPVAKDGAELPAGLRGERDARLLTNTGETFDVLWTPTAPGDYTLSVRYGAVETAAANVATQLFRVR